MKKNFLYTMLSLLLGTFLFQACQQDPIFPDPGFEVADQRVEVRRDTADFYDIKIKMNVPNGVKEIKLLDATDYSVLEDITEYNGKTNFDFTYRVDLTPIEKDSILNYIVKVTDKDNRSFNRGIRISVKAFSFPQISLVGGSNVAVAGAAYIVKGKITTGLNTISSVKVMFAGQEQYSFTADPNTPLHEMNLKALVTLGNLQTGVQYPITVHIVDNIGQISDTEIIVTKSNFIKKPIQMNFLNSSGALINVKFKYDTQGRMTTLDYILVGSTSTLASNTHYEFYYNDLNMVYRMLYRETNAVSGAVTRDTYTNISFVAGTKKVFDVKTQITTYDAGGNASIAAETVSCSSFVYNTNNVLTSFRTTAVVDNIRSADPFNLGETIYTDYFQQDSYMSSTTTTRQHVKEYDPILMPTYIEGLTPFTKITSGSLQIIFNEMLYSKYLMTKVIRTSSTSTSTALREPSFKYETDNEGNLTAFIRTDNQGTVTRYTFFYE